MLHGRFLITFMRCTANAESAPATRPPKTGDRLGGDDPIFPAPIFNLVEDDDGCAISHLAHGRDHGARSGAFAANADLSPLQYPHRLQPASDHQVRRAHHDEPPARA